jgi:integrase/recombinase XerC
MTRERFLSDAELAAFMAAVRERRHKNQPRDYAFFALLANTGIRPSEALALHRADCHLDGLRPWIRVTRLKKKKLVPEFDELQITPELAAMLAPHVATVDLGATVFAFGKRQAERSFHHYSRVAGLRPGRWLYSLRHTAATRIYLATRDIHVVQAILGHERPDMSCIYAHVTRALLRESAGRMAPAI